MPELAEIKIMSDYINSVCSAKDFTSISTSSVASNKLKLVQPSDLQIFSISADARGKELMLILTSGIDKKKISVSMGMSGHWLMIDSTMSPKHTHLKFNTVDGKCLCLIDARRFAKWKWADTWSNNRGPCPVNETPQFIENVHANLDRAVFKKPIHLLLMDQKYFNGIGNYLRAEILFRADQDPFEDSKSAILNNPIILDLCTLVPLEAYVMGGGQLKDWKNPFNFVPTNFDLWVQCYGKSDCSIIDRNGRKLWYYSSQIKNKQPNP
jgi:endonuclease VIII-like 1